MNVLIEGNPVVDSFTNPLNTIIQFGQEFQRILTEKNISEVFGAIEYQDVQSIVGENNKAKRLEIIQNLLNYFICKHNRCSRNSSVARLTPGSGHYGDFLIFRNEIVEYGNALKDFNAILQQEFKFTFVSDIKIGQYSI